MSTWLAKTAQGREMRRQGQGGIVKQDERNMGRPEKMVFMTAGANPQRGATEKMVFITVGANPQREATVKEGRPLRFGATSIM